MQINNNYDFIRSMKFKNNINKTKCRIIIKGQTTI